MKYLLKLWLTTLLVSPFVVCCLLALGDDKSWINSGTAILLLSLMVLTGLTMSVPAMAILFVLKTYLEKKNTGIVKLKALISLYAIAAIYITFVIADYTFVFSLRNNLWWPVVYCMTALFSIYYFRIKTDTIQSQINRNEQPRTDT
ncbi:hypothetical protein [Flavobacterium coralii]|uniref:hypothetical protein n=1 Tax=Flavobacterium coralii TaxID=2838017 RepID=UPI000C64F962|nr:hypothetical protein [Flavobacterium sp.]|tara:strand:- start:201 stop:638 length:438 start_codon:yes stop_codon:yes gene_type:complete